MLPHAARGLSESSGWAQHMVANRPHGLGRMVASKVHITMAGCGLYLDYQKPVVPFGSLTGRVGTNHSLVP